MSNLNLPKLLSALPSNLLVPTKYADVYSVVANVTSPLRMSLISEIHKQLPVLRLWMRDHINDHVFAELGSPFSVSGTARFWQFDDQTEIQRILPKLTEGGWALFFFETAVGRPEPPQFLPSDLSASASLLRGVNAGAAIVSWYDDIEWELLT